MHIAPRPGTPLSLASLPHRRRRHPQSPSPATTTTTTMEAAAGGAREVQVMKTKRLKKKEAAAGGVVRKEQVMKTKKSPPPSPEQVKMPCRSYSAENIKQRLTKTVKEHRARFYIIRRCIQMLICWRDEY